MLSMSKEYSHWHTTW